MNSNHSKTSIKIIGIGGCGASVAQYITRHQNINADYLLIDNDSLQLKHNAIQQNILLNDITSDELEKYQNQIIQHLADVKLIVLIAGLGGKTGSKITPLIANMMQKQNIRTSIYVIKPFEFEGKARMESANFTLAQLAIYTDSLSVFSNQETMIALGKNGSLLDLFNAINQQIVDCIAMELA